MAKLTPSILEGDIESDIVSNILSLCSVSLSEYHKDPQVFTRDIFEESLSIVLKYVESHPYKRIALLILGYFVLQTGSRVENHTKESIINACNWNHEEDNWDWEYKLQRRFYLNDLRYKLSNLKLGVPSFLVSLKNVNNEDILNGIVGIDQFKDSLRSKKIFTVEHINLDSCKISKIPSIIFKSTKLKTLSLDHNQIKKIPRSICNLQFLRGLYLEGNQIRKIPNCIQNMRHLKVLVLKNNRIPEISINTSPLSSLKCLVL